MVEKSWRVILSGFLYELFYEIALALRWITIKEKYSFIIAGAVGILIAIILGSKNTFKLLPATLLGLLSAFVFHVASLLLDIPLKVLFYCDPFMKEVGHFTVNENITAAFVTVGYLLISLIAFLLGIGAIYVLKKSRRKAI